MKDFRSKIAVITGAGTGMGRELARQLASEGCHLALCDVLIGNLDETGTTCRELAPPGTRITLHRCDVAVEDDVLAFRDEVLEQHSTDHVHLLFNNAGIGGGGSFLVDDRSEWDRTFGVCWFGVYFCSRAFLPLLVAGPEGVVVNISSLNGFWATLGPGNPHTAYSAAKFAVKGFTEALINDLATYAPHVKAVLVMPGHVGTSIAVNTLRLLGKPDPEEMSSEELAEMRSKIERQGIPTEGVSDDQLKAFVRQRLDGFQAEAPVSAAEAAATILDGVRSGRWRILVGSDAQALDRLVREDPASAYEPSFLARLQQEGHMRGSLTSQLVPATDS